MSACPYVRMSVCPHARMSVCPRFPPNLSNGTLELLYSFQNPNACVPKTGKKLCDVIHRHDQRIDSIEFDFYILTRN